tara:strand:- start:690 stop:1130 length:441 start_codon:yes stop_codon:yes gene_type:complete
VSETPAEAPKQAKPEVEAKPKAKPKPPKPEDKPFEEFIKEVFLPAIASELKRHELVADRLELINGDRPVVGGPCPMVVGELPGGRRFWLCFAKNDIASLKTITLADPGSEPTLLESFLIDEKRMTLALLVSRLMQRLNGQKWLGGN